MSSNAWNIDLAGAEELVDDQRQLALGAGDRGMFGQDQRRGLLARGLEVPEELGQGPARSRMLSTSLSPRRKIGLERPSSGQLGTERRHAVADGRRVARIGQLDRQEESRAASRDS